MKSISLLLLLLSACAATPVAPSPVTHLVEGTYGIIERPNGTINPHVEREGRPNNSVGNGRAYEIPKPTPLRCGQLAPYNSTHMVKQPWLDLASRWVITDYDTNGDGNRDIRLLTVPGTYYPRMYQFDLDHDYKVDVMLIDTMMNGSCDGLKLFWKKGEKKFWQYKSPRIPGTEGYNPHDNHDRKKDGGA